MERLHSSVSCLRMSYYGPFIRPFLWPAILILGIALALTACSSPPKAAITANVISGKAPLSVTFTNESSGANEFRWDFGDGESFATQDAEEAVTHRYTKAGNFTVNLTAAKESDPTNDSVASLIIVVEPGPLASLVPNQSQLSLQPLESFKIEVQGRDEFGNTVPNVTASFKASEASARVSKDGSFTAGTKAGVYTDAATIEASDGSATASLSLDVTVEPGPLDSVTLSPDSIQGRVASQHEFSATALDQYGNVITGLAFEFEALAGSGSITRDGLFTAATKSGSYPESISVEASQGGLTKSASASMELQPGPLDRVEISPSAPKLAVAEQLQFTATAMDQYGNAIPGLNYTFKADAQAGRIDATGNFTAATRAGDYDDAVTVATVQGLAIESSSVSVTLEHGPLSKVVFDPPTATLEIGDTQDFRAIAQDAFGNTIPEATFVWDSQADLGSITSSAVSATFTSGTRAGQFTDALVALATVGSTSVDGGPAITIRPGPLDKIQLVSPINVIAGVTSPVQAEAVDQYGNKLDDAILSVILLDPDAGTVSGGSQIAAGKVSRTFAGAIEITATQGGVSTSLTAEVAIQPGPLDRVVIGPSSVELGAGMTQQFVAVGADQYGNRVNGLEFTWSVEAGGGTISSTGLFTADSTPGTFDKTVKAVAIQGAITRSASASVTGSRIGSSSCQTGIIRRRTGTL